ncbi:MAG: TIM barrel protein [Spirochaetes bacterium]|nr:TIM barrel protein [Spirochaetota bacterium]
MKDSGKFALNRIACPSLSLPDFLAFAKKIGVGKIELRNDIRDGSVLDGMAPAKVAALLKERGLKAITINALQKFNLASARPKARAELAALLATCAEIDCPAIVLCPNNDGADKRPSDLRFAETVESLKEFGPMFEKAGVLGFLEPLGFGISSLASLDVAIEAIRASGFSCYRVLVDTFHHYLGPDSSESLKKAAASGLVGLVHISGVESAIPALDFRDAYRIMPGPDDVMKSKEIVQTLLDSGYKGDISFEPFSESVQKLPSEDLGAAIKKSIAWLSL